jgi:nucleoid DNA-binding protein
MNRSEAIKAAAEKSKVTVDQAETIVSAFIETCAEALVAGEPVSLWRFGKFEPRLRRSMAKVNPATGEPMSIPERLSVAFIPSDVLRERLNHED